MKAISLLQPWASLCVMGAKLIETRSWNTKHRGRLLIHASQKKHPAYRTLCEENKFFYKYISACGGYDNLPFGAVIGEVNVLKTVRVGDGGANGVGEPISEYYRNQRSAGKLFDLQEQIAFGDWGRGRWLWLLDPNTTDFGSPIPYKGGLSLWDFPDSAWPEVDILDEPPIKTYPMYPLKHPIKGV